MKLKHSFAVLAIPLFTYAISYCYLWVYHQNFWLFPRVVHEGGDLTLLETIFYASHFLGHIPVHTVLAFYYVGVWMSLRPTIDSYQSPGSISTYVVGGMLLLVGSYFISVQVFGVEDTFSFLLQQKQSMTVYRAGGSWLLHFPSTLLQLFLIPLYLMFFRWLFHLPIRMSSYGLKFIFMSFGLIFIFVLLAGAPWEAYLDLWSDPRYMAHSVRELATFPLTYFPLSLYLLLVVEKTSNNIKSRHITGTVWLLASICFVVFSGSFIYQVVTSLQAGVGNMAQKPDFAHQGTLSIGYLLASHYFEHVLDTIYFFLLCGVLSSFLSKARFSLSQPSSVLMTHLR